MTALAQVEALIANAIATSNTAQQQAIAYANAAQSAAGGALTFGPIPGITEPNVVIPPFDPTVDLTGDFRNAYNDAIADFDPAFQAQITDFISKYFPDIDGCLQSRIDDWICNTIHNGGTGLPAAVENAIWQGGRERAILDSRRVVDEAVSGFTARGWSLESGLLVDAVLRAQQDASDKASTINREVMIKQAEIEIENIKFAISEGVKLRLGAISALVQFLGAWAKMRELAIDKARALLEAKVQLYRAVAAYYSAIIGAAQLMLDFDKLKLGTYVSLADIDTRGFSDRLQSRVGAAISAADAMGKIASGAVAGLNSVVEVSHNTQGQE